MPRVITAECVKCGACAAQCPVNAISEGKERYEINKDECIDCGACQGECPMQAIKEE